MAETTVPLGRYRFFTRDQLDAEKQLYVAAVRAQSAQLAATGGQVLSATSAGGVSSTFTAPDGLTLEAWGDAIQDAYDQLDALAAGETPVPADRAVARFR